MPSVTVSLSSLIALVRGQGNGDGRALFRVGRRSVYAAVVDRRGGYLVGRLAGGAAAGGTAGGRLGVGELVGVRTGFTSYLNRGIAASNNILSCVKLLAIGIDRKLDRLCNGYLGVCCNVLIQINDVTILCTVNRSLQGRINLAFDSCRRNGNNERAETVGGEGQIKLIIFLRYRSGVILNLTVGLGVLNAQLCAVSNCKAVGSSIVTTVPLVMFIG